MEKQVTKPNRTLNEQVEKYRTIIDDLSFPTVREWKENHPGAKVVGMFPVYTPCELPHAMGMLPIGLFGAGGRIEIDHADSKIQSFVCSIARSTLELGLTDRLKDFDAIFFTSICDVARNLSGLWQTNFPGQLVEYIHFPQNVTSRASVAYHWAELDRLRRDLEGLGGKKLRDSALNESIAVYNRNRSLCSQLYDIRQATPWLLSMYDAYVLLDIGTLIPVEQHSQMLEELIPTIGTQDRRPRDYVRVLIEGSFCEQPPLELLKVIEEAGCYIVNDDLLLHTRWFREPVPVEGDPLEELAKSYVLRSNSSSVRHYGDKPRREQFLRKVQAANADGVIFCAPKFCEPALLDYVLLKDELERAGITYLAFEYEEKMSVFESIRTQIETFVESVMFFS